MVLLVHDSIFKLAAPKTVACDSRDVKCSHLVLEAAMLPGDCRAHAAYGAQEVKSAVEVDR